LNRSEESGHLFLIPDFRGNGFSFSNVCGCALTKRQIWAS
jgi:hypothetical protein